VRQSPFNPRPVTLEGRFVRLEPMSADHAEGLFEAGRFDELWTYMSVPPWRTVDDARQWMSAAMAAAEAGDAVPFVTIERAGGRAVGSTRFFDIRRAHRALEIGHTWVAPAFQRTAINTEAKLLLLGHAFDELGALRLQFKTDARNVRSQRALERIGALREGVLRRHMVLWDGFVRDSVCYSVIDTEWPAVRAKLESMLRRA